MPSAVRRTAADSRPQVGGLLSQLLDRIAAIQQFALVAVDIGDCAFTGRGRGEAGVVSEDIRFAVKLSDIKHIGPDRGFVHGQIIGLPRPGSASQLCPTSSFPGVAARPMARRPWLSCTKPWCSFKTGGRRSHARVLQPCNGFILTDDQHHVIDAWCDTFARDGRPKRGGKFAEAKAIVGRDLGQDGLQSLFRPASILQLRRQDFSVYHRIPYQAPSQICPSGTIGREIRIKCAF